MSAKTRAIMSVAAELLEALKFVSVLNNNEYVALVNNFAIATDGQITCGHPITEDLNSYPHLERFRIAVNKAGKSLAITELPNSKISIKGEKLTVTVDCINANDFPHQMMVPNPNIAKIDDKIKTAFQVCGVAVSENGTRMHETALLLEANQCTATDGKILIQYWHGIDLPPNLVVPKLFASIVGKVKSPLVGFGWQRDHSITFYFENGAWVKTQLYNDKYPNVDNLINQPAPAANAVTPEFFEAMETVGQFNDDQTITIGNGVIASGYGGEQATAKYEIQTPGVSISFDSDYTKLIAPFVQKIDLTTYEDRAFWFGDKVRGIIMACRRVSEKPGEAVREPEQAFRTDVPLPKTFGDENDGIPF